MSAPSSTLQAIVVAAVEATGATQGRLVVAGKDGLRVVAASGGESPRSRLGLLTEGTDTVAYVLSSGQPVARQPQAGDAVGAGGLGERSPSSVLCVPCTAGDDVVAALEVVDKQGGPFNFDDVEVATLLGSVAGPAVVELGGVVAEPPSPGALGAELARLAAADPARYARIAGVVDALLGRA